MDMRLNRESIPACEIIFDGVQEQGIELDYILPDYYPDIFRLVRCETVPSVTEWSISGDKLSYELRCEIRIIYCPEGGGMLQCVVQRQSFRKTVETGSLSGKPSVNISVKSDHVNFRAVNKRRLDVRGAVSVRISLMGEKQQEVITDVKGMNVQLRKIPVNFAMRCINTEKVIHISEDTELAPAQPSAACILTVECTPGETEKKLISGKLLAKGETNIRLLYSCEKDGEASVEPLEFSVPYSQIIDIDGLDDTFECTVAAETVSCEITPAADRSGENRLLHCEVSLRLMCSAVKNSSTMICTDAFSTIYPCEIMTAPISTAQIPEVYHESFRKTVKIAEGDDIPAAVYSMWCTPKNINTTISPEGDSVVISGMLTYSMAAKDSAGLITMPDKDEAFEETISIGKDLKGCSVSSRVSVKEISYNISQEGVLNAKAAISADISVCSCVSVEAVTGIEVDSSAEKVRDGDYAIKLYFGSEGEDIWDIAKRYSTSVDAVAEENELTGDKLASGGMLLIPIVTRVNE